ncbi:hypothetical protein AAVH_04627 [Aphelenchoides avenae]|nr:hypothetical protein AAVH_04627 [Aphelenchus avenae]
MGDDQYEFINPPAKPGDAPTSNAPPASATGDPGDAESTQTNLKTELTPSAMPEAKDFGAGQSACTAPTPPVDDKTQKNGVKGHVKRRSTCGMVVSIVCFFVFVGIAIGGVICVVLKVDGPF